MRRTTVLCDNDVGLWINAIGETSPAPLGNRRRARDGTIGSRALHVVIVTKFDNVITFGYQHRNVNSRHKLFQIALFIIYFAETGEYSSWEY